MRKNLLAALLGLTVASTAAAAPEFTWTFAAQPVPGSTYDAGAKAFAERITAATNGRLEIRINSSLVPPNRFLEAVRDNQAQLAATVIGFYSATQPVFTLSLLPGVSESLESLRRLMSSEYGEAVREVYAREYNAKVLLTTAWCHQAVISKRPLHTLEDWNGARVRVHNTGAATLATQLGARPVPLITSEVLPALQRGVVDAVITDNCVAFGAGFYNAAKHVSIWELGSVPPWSVVVNQDAWAALPEDLRETVQAEVERLEEDLYADWEATVKAMPARWQEKGVSYHVVSAEENARLQSERYMKPVLEAWYEQAEKKGLRPRELEQAAREAVGR